MIFLNISYALGVSNVRTTLPIRFLAMVIDLYVYQQHIEQPVHK
jgi:hypothetical protein